VPEFAYDVVDVGRQLLANRFLAAYENLVTVYNTNTSTAENVEVAGKELLYLLSDIDTLLFTNRYFLVANWIGDAKAWAHGNVSYSRYLEYNARNQISLWGPDGEINDYASKQWGGIVGGYYLPRWSLFVKYLKETKANGTAYNQTEITSATLTLGKVWSNGTWGVDNPQYETWATKGNTWDVIENVLAKWG
jgi:alpha-N-acetylglucosaminidase